MRKPAAAFLDAKVTESLRITTIDKNTCVYIEIYRRLRNLIVNRVLNPGDSLPGESALASIMCVGRSSLRTALSLLSEDGYIETVRGKGSCVANDSGRGKLHRDFPAEILLPPDRIALSGECSVNQEMWDYVEGDEFLDQKLLPAQGQRIVQLQQLYYLNDKPAILSFYYFTTDLFPFCEEDAPRTVYEKMAAALTTKILAAEHECIPTRMVNPSGLYQLLPRGVQSLVTTQYLGANGTLVFAKDYYNSEVMRFRIALRK
jgi:GntR family trehalose operon transcriptional repressor